MMRKIAPILVVGIITVCPLFNIKAAPLYLIYTSNINGFLQNCGCGTEPLGGISRIKYLIDTFKTKHPDVLLIDGGDYFNSYPFPALNEAMFKVLKLMDYDVLVPGDQEFVEGSLFFGRLSKNYGDNFLLTNANSDFSKVSYHQIAQQKVVFYGLLSEKVFEFIDKPADLLLSSLFSLPRENKMTRGLHVVVIHGYLSDAQIFAQKFNDIDLILIAHDQHRGIWKTSETTIIGNGSDSEYISVIQADYDQQWKISVDQIKISERMPEDKDVLEIIENYTKQAKLN